ncbi:MAG TPA: CoA-binding protein [Dehalococcoidia bacterium]|nr:CoA-binding protein [Dehalococcoidia bacterium]
MTTTTGTSAYEALDYLFHPRSVAVVGASTSGGPGGFVESIQEMGFSGALYPVNPKATEINGLPCYPSLRDVPGEVDYVISSIPAHLVPQMIEDAAVKGVRTIHFFTAGFSETGDEERAALERRILERCRELGIRVIGPNCMGLYVPASGLSFMPGMPKEPGTVAFISQSGANAGDFCRTAGARGVRYSKVISYGNGADLREIDFFAYCAEDPDTEVIAAYIEGVKDGRRFLEVLRYAASRKPVVILKGGRTDAGGRATASHTGSLAGSLQIFDAVCRQAGAVRVDTMEELVDTVTAMRFLKSLPGPGVAIVGGGGGHSVLAADEVASAGLDVPVLPDHIQRKLMEFTPVAGTSVRNPVDTNVGWGPQGNEAIANTIRIVAEADVIDVVLYHTGFGWGPTRGAPDLVKMAQDQARVMGEVMRETGKPLVVVARPPLSVQGMDATVAFHEEAARQGIAVFPSVGRAAVALAKVRQAQDLRRQAAA